LQSIADKSGSNPGLPNGTSGYVYDANGNLLTQTNTTNTAANKTFTYNMLNLPQDVTIPAGTVTFTYDATGRKLRETNTAGVGTTTDYIDGIEYDNGALVFAQTEEGRVMLPGGNVYQYNLTDHLGNVRLTFDTHASSATQVQQDDYYPFGLEIARGTAANPKNEYLYNKKELQEELTEYDYGARFYDPVIGRFNTIDRFAEKYSGYTPYQYGADNPISNIDMNGDSVGVSKSITQNKDLNKAFNAFAATKAGLRFLAKYAAKGQTIGGHTFTKSGKYNDKGIDLNYGAANLANTHEGGETSASIGANGRAEINVTLNTQTREDVGIKSSADDIFDKASSFIHESFIHADLDTKDYLDNGKFDNSNIDPSIKYSADPRQWQHSQVYNNYIRTGSYNIGRMWPDQAYDTLQEINQKNQNGRTPQQVVNLLWNYSGGVKLDNNGNHEKE
jgi:RHS repeat-associated protein